MESRVLRASMSLAAFLIAAIPSRALANTAIPGVLVVSGMGATSQGLLWFLLAMTTCVLTEGAILRTRCPLIAHPYSLSCRLNLASVLLGSPLGLLTAILWGNLLSNVLLVGLPTIWADSDTDDLVPLEKLGV